MYNPIKIIHQLKFHKEGLAAVQCEERLENNQIQIYWKHINLEKHFFYKEKYFRTFGYYFEQAAVNNFNQECYHIDKEGNRIYQENYSWVGNYQQSLVAVRLNNDYFHLNKVGKRYYDTDYRFVGDYKDDYAAVKMQNGYYNFINTDGKELYHETKFLDLGVFHKNIATARDCDGYFHIDKQANSLYKERYLQVEPFYNGFAVVTNIDYSKKIISETGQKVIDI